jgi:hypothetical protein
MAERERTISEGTGKVATKWEDFQKKVADNRGNRHTGRPERCRRGKGKGKGKKSE